MRRGYCKVLNSIAMLSFPMLAGMLAVAPEFIRSVYGVKWEPSIHVLQILCVVGMFKSLGNPIGSIILAKGRADIGFYWNIFTVIMVFLTVIVGIQWGIVGVATAILILQFPLFSIIQPIVNRLIDLKFRQYVEAIQLPLACSIIMLAGIIVVKILAGNMNEILLFVLTVTIGVIIYTVSYYLQDKTVLVELKSLVKGN